MSLSVNRLRALFGPYFLLLTMSVLMLFVLSVSRLGLIVWQYDRVSAVVPLVTILLQGVRADLILVGFWLVVPVLAAPFMATPLTWRIWTWFCYVWAMIGLVSIVFVELSTPQFILQYDVRPNRLYIEYLKYPKEVFSMLWQGYRGMVFVALVLTLGIAWASHQILQRANHAVRPYRAWVLWISWPLVFVSVFMAIRSTLDHRPANPATFAITSDALVNSLVINSPYSILYALYNLRHEARSSEIYGKMTTETMLRETLDWPWLASYHFDHATYPTSHYQSASRHRDKPLNLVIVLEESLGATFVESLGGLAVTPELDKLKSEGWWFERLYATGTRSVRGIEAVISGYMPTPAQSVVKLSLSERNFYTLGSALSEQGYHTSFIYGGEAHFDNMRSFFSGNGFQEIIDQQDIETPTFVGSWGASDEDVFKQATSHLRDRYQQGTPFFSLIFTSSNHSPFEFPDGRIELHEEPKATVNNAVKYADYALGQFIAQAKQEAYWQDTLFLIVADHDTRVYGNNLVPVEKFHIPGLILGADIQPKHIRTIASQIDLAPTLLSLMGISSQTPLIGRDFTHDDTSPGRALMQFDQYFALMEGDYLTILRPEQPAVAAHFDGVTRQLTLLNTPVSDAQKQRALAHALLPSYLYREQRYRP